MTSSFQRRQNLNYLNTEADLSGAVNKEIDSGIKDTQRFYQEMVELEKLRYQNRDDNLKALTGLIASAGPIFKDIQKANESRRVHKKTTDALEQAKSNIEVINQKEIENETKEVATDVKKLAQSIKTDLNKATTEEEKDLAHDAYISAAIQGITYEDDLTNKLNLQQLGAIVPEIFNGLSKDVTIDSVGNKMLKDATSIDEFNDMVDEYRLILIQKAEAEAQKSGRSYTKAQMRLYLGDDINKHIAVMKKEWQQSQTKMVEEESQRYLSNQVKSIFASPNTAEEFLGKNGWLANRKAEYEAGGRDSSEASFLAYQDLANFIIPAMSDPQSGVTPADVRALIYSRFTPIGSSKKVALNKFNSRGAKYLVDKLLRAAEEVDREGFDQKQIEDNQDMMLWKDTKFTEFMKANNNRPSIEALGQHKLDFMDRFSITKEEQLPEWLKTAMTDNFVSDEKIILEIEGRRSKNLPITQSMIDKIVDPDKRAAQSKFVNTPELGAFTDEEAEAMDERVVAIVKEAKQLRDLDKAKTDKYIVTRDNTKKYITSRFKELVIGGQSRETAMFNAIREAKALVKDGTFDKEETLSIDVQATKDLDSTLKAIGKDPSLIYSTEEWAGEAPHLAIAREYVRTKGKSKYPAYYMRFNFIKNSDGAYLTPEEIFETRVNKVDKKEAEIQEIPERKELDNVEDQNKLLNKTNGTKILDVALKNKNIEWMTSLPSFSSINAEMFVKRLEDNIQNQHTITGIGQTHRTKTTLSAEDSNKLLEAVPELEEAPFLNPNTLSTAAINEMLNLNI